MDPIEEIDIECGICLENYTLAKYKRPYILPNCHHNLCEACIKLLIGNNTEFSCPFCRTTIMAQLNKFSLNYTIITYLIKNYNVKYEEYDNREKCSNCNVNHYDIKCTECDIKVCEDCWDIVHEVIHTHEKLYANYEEYNPICLTHKIYKQFVCTEVKCSNKGELMCKQCKEELHGIHKTELINTFAKKQKQSFDIQTNMIYNENSNIINNLINHNNNLNFTLERLLTDALNKINIKAENEYMEVNAKYNNLTVQVNSMYENNLKMFSDKKELLDMSLREANEQITTSLYHDNKILDDKHTKLTTQVRDIHDHKLNLIQEQDIKLHTFKETNTEAYELAKKLIKCNSLIFIQNHITYTEYLYNIKKELGFIKRIELSNI